MNIRDKARASTGGLRRLKRRLVANMTGYPRQGPAGHARRGTFIFHFAFRRRDLSFH